MAATSTAALPTDELFYKSVQCVFRRWTLLRLAVENDWGGDGDTEAKAAWLMDYVIELFPLHHQSTKRSANKDVIDLYDLIEDVSIIMEQEFNIQAEDGSVEAVCKHICKLYKQVTTGLINDVAAFVDAELGVQQTPLNCVDASIDSELENEMLLDHQADNIDMTALNVGTKPEPEHQTNTVDDDGWATVPVKGKGRRR